MLGNTRGASPLSETMSESAPEQNPAERALLANTPAKNSSQVSSNKMKSRGGKSYSDKNGNDMNKAENSGRKTFAFWTVVILLFLLALGNLALTFTILAVLRLGHGLESMEFLPEHNAVKFMGTIDLEQIHKRDGIIESFRDEPLTIESQNGSVVINVQTRYNSYNQGQSRTDTTLVANTSGLFFNGVNSLKIVDPSGETVFSSEQTQVTVEEPLNNLHAKQISTKRLIAPIDEDLTIRSDASIHLRGAEGTHMESKELLWSADQDIYLKSINGSVILSGKEGVYVDVRYLPIAIAVNKTSLVKASGQFKVCVCMPQGRLFRVAVPSGQSVTCNHINVQGDHNPCV